MSLLTDIQILSRMIAQIIGVLLDRKPAVVVILEINCLEQGQNSCIAMIAVHIK